MTPCIDMAGAAGLEPTVRVLETLGLPLTDTPIAVGRRGFQPRITDIHSIGNTIDIKQGYFVHVT